MFMFSMSSAIIFEMKLIDATISVSSPARGPKPTIFTKKMATMTSWNVRESTITARANA